MHGNNDFNLWYLKISRPVESFKFFVIRNIIQIFAINFIARIFHALEIGK